MLDSEGSQTGIEAEKRRRSHCFFFGLVGWLVILGWDERGERKRGGGWDIRFEV